MWSSMHLLIVYYSSQKLSPKASSDTILDQITRKRFKVALTRIGLIGKFCSQKKVSKSVSDRADTTIWSVFVVNCSNFYILLRFETILLIFYWKGSTKKQKIILGKRRTLSGKKNINNSQPKETASLMVKCKFSSFMCYVLVSLPMSFFGLMIFSMWWR